VSTFLEWAAVADFSIVVTLVVEFATLTLDSTTGRPLAEIYKPAEIDALLAKHGFDKKDDDATR